VPRRSPIPTSSGSADLIEDLKGTLEATNHELSRMVALEVFVAPQISLVVGKKDDG
jgi:hypothetical protein